MEVNEINQSAGISSWNVGPAILCLYPLVRQSLSLQEETLPNISPTETKERVSN